MSGNKKTGSLLRTTDLASILDCCPDDLILLARKGKLKATRLGRFWRFREADVATYKKRMEKLRAKES